MARATGAADRIQAGVTGPEGKQRRRHPPDDVESTKQAAVSGAARRADDAKIQVEGDGHRPEEGAGVGEGGERALQHAVPRGALEVLQHPVEVGGGREQVGQRQEEQQAPRPAAQVGPQAVRGHQQARA